MVKKDKGALKTFKCNEKLHSTMKNKYFLLLSAEHLHFLVKKAGWLVTKIHTHYTFEQSKFKKDFAKINQVSREKAKAKSEKDFYKQMNNSNFGYDCTNNINNCTFKPIFDDVKEIAYIEEYSSLFDDVYKDFLYPDLIATQIENEYNNELMKIDQNDLFAEAEHYDVGEKRKRKMDALDSHKSKIKRKTIAKGNNKKTEDFLENQQTKMIIDFDCETSASINSLAVNKTSVLKLTTRFFSGKIRMFAKLSLMSFIYEMLETFHFPNGKTKIIYS